MNINNLLNDIIATYRKHGWELKTALLRLENMQVSNAIDWGEAEIRVSEINALWFSRPSHNAAEAWELRLVAETPYALFERIDVNESEERRSEVLRKVEQRLREYVTSS